MNLDNVFGIEMFTEGWFHLELRCKILSCQSCLVHFKTLETRLCNRLVSRNGCLRTVKYERKCSYTFWSYDIKPLLM